MNLYLLRHGEAESRAYNDPERQLTSRGRHEIEQVARQFAVRQLPLDCCFASPYTRAQQTAEHFLQHSGFTLPIQHSDILIPEVRASAVMTFLAGLQVQSVLLVSHNPLLSELNALLTEGDISHMHILGTGELICVKLDVLGLGMGSTAFRLLPQHQSNLS